MSLLFIELGTNLGFGPPRPARLIAPVRLHGRRYMDGGIASATNADIASGHREVWIVSSASGDVREREVADLQAGD